MKTSWLIFILRSPISVKGSVQGYLALNYVLFCESAGGVDGVDAGGDTGGDPGRYAVVDAGRDW